MAALETIRTKFGIGATIIIAIGLLLFLVSPQDILGFFQSSGNDTVGKIDGKKISYEEFNDKVAEYSRYYESEGLPTSGEDIQRQIRDEVWNDLVIKNLYLPAIEKAGVSVGEDELRDAFSLYFYDQDGVYSDSLAQQFDAECKEKSQLGEMRRRQRKYMVDKCRTGLLIQKYYALFNAAGYVNSLEVRRAIEENNTVANVDFVMVPNSYYPVDSSIVVSPAEIERYYKDHKENYKQEEARVIEYAVFDGETPSAADVEAENEKFASLYDSFGSADNMRAFLLQNSDRQLDENWYKDGELYSGSSELDSWVSENKDGVSPVFRSGDSFYAARIMETASVPDSVYVRRILLSETNDSKSRQQAEELLSTLKNGSFSEVAVTLSLDKINAADGEMGNLGWLTQEMISGSGFESVFTARIGQPFILTNRNGVNVVEVTKATKALPKKKVAIFAKTAIASDETNNAAFNKAQQLTNRAAGDYEKYKAACEEMGIHSQTTTITMSGGEAREYYSGVSDAKNVTRWAFDNKAGKVSEELDKVKGGKRGQVYFVVAVKEVKKEGYAPLADVSEAIRSKLYRQKYSQSRKEKVAADIAGLASLEEIAEKLGTTVSNLTEVSFSTSSAPSTDPAFIGAVASAKEGVISGPVAGSNGIYVFKVNSRETRSFFTEDDAKQAQSRIENRHAQLLFSKESEEKVKDNRARFF
ncbi:MAG: SurA N-terminal domain-containing protein [Bacteroidales bacterium]|nr:SurA N-terminal domain-containing protein [Bacteroidales bacterium]